MVWCVINEDVDDVTAVEAVTLDDVIGNVEDDVIDVVDVCCVTSQ